MKRYRVPVESWQYYGVYVYADNEKEAIKKVEEMIANDTVHYDDEGDGDVNVAECGIVDEIDENGDIIW